MTAGEALREVERPTAEFPNKISWGELRQDRRDDYETLAARILSDAAAIRERMGEGWEPVETAPRDGTMILWSHEPGKFHAICWPDYEECFDAVGSVWHPIPALPEPPQ